MERICNFCLCLNLTAFVVLKDNSGLLPPGPYFTLPISNKNNIHQVKKAIINTFKKNNGPNVVQGD